MRKTEVRIAAHDDHWFVPKMFGLGAKPVTWQGWALTLGSAALLWLDIHFMPERIAQVGVGVALVMLFSVIAIRKTRGGWAWHWGWRE